MVRFRMPGVVKSNPCLFNPNAAQQSVHRTWGGLPRFLGIFPTSADSRFDGESTPSPQAGNAGRWAGNRLTGNKLSSIRITT
jgi:hypothetical protein